MNAKEQLLTIQLHPSYYVSRNSTALTKHLKSSVAPGIPSSQFILKQRRKHIHVRKNIHKRQNQQVRTL